MGVGSSGLPKSEVGFDLGIDELRHIDAGYKNARVPAVSLALSWRRRRMVEDCYIEVELSQTARPWPGWDETSRNNPGSEWVHRAIILQQRPDSHLDFPVFDPRLAMSVGGLFGSQGRSG